MNAIEIYQGLVLQKVKIVEATLGLRQIGEGKNLVVIHGFPTHGYTWRKLLPRLSSNFKCHVLDLPGLGSSEWTEKTDFSSKSQAGFVMALMEKIGIDKYSLIAHNSGATVARYIAIVQPKKIENLIVLNTEIPNHRPPWIPFYQKVGLLPFVPRLIRILLKQKGFVTSPLGFREFYTKKSMLDVESNISPYTKPVIDSQKKTIGAFKYLKGIDWVLVDAFKNLHGSIKARTLFLWGEDDRTFPLKLARQMVYQFNSETQFITIKKASLLPHEERPDEVAQAILKFIKEN
nr:alpha/beta hydrolase [uncultured Allomuricauda sp.]